MEQFALPNPIVAAQNERCSRRRLVAASAPHQGNEQLSLSLRSSRRPRRQRPCNPNAAAHALALSHLDLADKIAGNFARRTTHAFDDLRQLAVIGLLKAAARFDGTGGRSFRPYARTYANSEITHYPGLIESLSQVSLAGLRPLGSVGGNGFLLCQNPLLPMSLPT